MKSSATSALLAEDRTPATAGKFHEPNDQGIFENSEQVFIALPGGNICHLHYVMTEQGYRGGHRFFTRQPRNLIERFPNMTDSPVRATKELVLVAELELALRFFMDHRTALVALAVWAVKHLPEAEVSTLKALALDMGMPWWANFDASHSEVAAAATSQSVSIAGPEIAKAYIEKPAVEAAAAPTRAHYAEIPVNDIEPGDNPRRSRDPAAQAELAESIRTTGLLQAIAVRDMGAGREGKPDTKRYRIIFGEGRWLAHHALGRETIEAKVYAGVDGATALALALVENLQRQDMNAIDEAEGFAELSRMGWSRDRMAEQTGKSGRAIQYALALMKLPDSVRALVRDGELSARQARALVRWVSPAGFKTEVEAAGFVALPRVCEIIADIARKSNCDISSDDLAEGVPSQAIGGLLAEKLLVEVPATYWNEFGIERDPGAVIIHDPHKRCYTFDVEGWKAAKKKIDADQRDRERERAEKAAKRVEQAAASKVSVPLAALKESKTEHVILTGGLEIYADYLPEECVGTGIDPVTKGEVILCKDPAKLKLLRDEEAFQTTTHDNDAYARALVAAVEKVKKLKKVGPREMALLISGGSAHIHPADFKRVGLREPKGWTLYSDNTIEQLAMFNPLDQARLVLVGLIPETVGNWEQDTVAAICWLLETDRLGVIADDPREREKLLARISKEIFTPVPAATEAKAAPAKPEKKRAKKSAKKGGRK